MTIKDGSLIIPLDQITPGLKMAFKDADKRFFVSTDFLQNNEAQFQFTEGVYYAYELFEAKENDKTDTEWSLDLSKALKGVFRPFSNGDTSEGMFVPNTFVGTLKIPLQKGDQKAHFQIEVHSSKIDYRDRENLQNKLGQFRSEYQLMLEEIVEHSMDLIMQYNVPVEQTYESGTEQISDKELYQRFIFVRSLFKNQEFEEAVQKIISNPATKWDMKLEPQDIRSIRRFTSKNIRELISGPNRMNLTKSIADLTSIPTRISSNQKVESIDTPENRFIKYILTGFQDFCLAILPKLNNAKLTQETAEVQSFTHRLDNLLNQPFFREINRPTSLKLNSPVLQRRSGYRELLRAWLRFHVTAQLSWKFDNDQDNLFTGGKKDIASLYEYWVFFVLFRTLTQKFGDYSKKSPKDWLEGLIVSDKHGLGLTLQEGKTRAFEFAHTHGKRRLTIKFYYNRSFRGNRKYAENEISGSYSKSLRPDYTLSIWPSELTQIKSEENGSIVHIHFDAKYKVDYSFFKEDKTNELATLKKEELDKLIEEDKQLIEEIDTIEKEERRGIYKNVDLYKMHTYKDAIRRSGGAYVLYPGISNEDEPFRGFHEIIPGVGAFSLRPNNEGESSDNIKQFIDKVIDNLEDVLSQRERMARSARKVYANTYKSQDPKVDTLLRQLNSTEIPDETQVLVGYCKGEKHRNWISGDTKNMRYNIRYGNGYDVNGKMASAQYLVLYSDKDFLHQEIFRVKPDSTRIYTKDEMKDLQYKNPSHPLYLVFELAEKIELDDTYHFDKHSPNLSNKLAELGSNYRPFTMNLLELAEIRKLIN
jgi:predicted component of viral defense system (DUF524 family)